MKIRVTVLLLVLVLSFFTLPVYALDYPHTSVNNIGCNSCHFVYGSETSLLIEGLNYGQNIDDTQYNALCWSCHNDIQAPYRRTHSSLQIDNDYGDWSVECKTCHYPHSQKQFRTHGSDSYLTSGVSANITATTLTKTGAGWTVDAYLGRVLIPNVLQKKYGYKITGNTVDTITVEGQIDLTKAGIGNTFVIIYGKLIQSTIELDEIIGLSKTGDKTVRFFNKTGTNSFADGNGTYDGICEACHTQTTHFRNDGNGPDQLHGNVGTPAGTNCIDCHSHTGGFAHDGGSGVDCDECHGHDPGYGGATGGKGTYETHSTHTENDADDLRGPNVDCDTCHNIGSFPDFADGVSYADYKSGEEMTTVCDTCHSPDGTYDGVSDAAVGAKNNWANGVYEADGSLTSGKEKWCATCHDETPSQISGIDAPNIIGDEDGSYKYGTGWGFYKTGHGLEAGENFPSKGDIETLAGRPIECNTCHDSSLAHIDGDARTLDCGADQFNLPECDPAEYRTSYRLKMVGGLEPMEIPRTDWVTNTTDQSRLCYQCHDSGPFIDSNNVNTNFGDWNAGSYSNRHVSHLTMFFQIWPPDYNFTYADTDGDGDQDLVAASRPTCVTCHNVHGSTNLAMVRSGKLINREPGLEIWYGNEDLAIPYWGGDAPDPENIPLSASTGTIWRHFSAGNVCSGCHIPGMVASYNCVEGDIGYPGCTQPFQPDAMQPPILAWTGENGYVNDGVNPESAIAGSVFSFRIEYTDVNNDAPTSIQLWIDKDDDDVYENNGDADLDEKIDMVGIDPRDISYWDGKIYNVNISLNKAGDSTFKYRFYTVGGGDTVELPSGSDLTVSVSNNRPVLSWTGESYFETDGVHLNTGGLGSNFEFRITYTDADGECPVSGSSDIQVWIDENDNGYEGGEKHNLIEESAGDTDCTDGKIYKLTRALSTAGAHNYTFYATDGLVTATGDTGPVSNNTVTVQATANNPPQLDWSAGTCVTDGVKPTLGADGADYEFMVTYTDPDNQCPVSGSSDIQVWVDEDNDGYEAGEKYNMTEVDAGDTDCTDGKAYELTRQLSTVGAFDYRFYASDGTDTAIGEAISSKVVTVIDAKKVRPSGGTDWYSTIQSAITWDITILVYEGTYTENLSYTSGNGNNSNVTLQSVCGPEVTIIQDSDGTNNTIYIQGVANPVIDGFTISGGIRGIYLNGGVTVKNSIIENNGYGLYSGTTGSVLIVEDTVIRNNVTSGSGAGIFYNSGGPHTITGSVISNNETGGSGGGIFLQNSGNGLTIEDTTISNNTSGGTFAAGGGGIYITKSKLDIDKVTISSNIAAGSGGALYMKENSTVTMTNSNIVDNTAGSYGGGIFLGNYNSLIGNLNMTNCTVSNNKLTDTTDGIGGGIYNRLSNVSINNSIFWGNEAAGIFSAHEAYTSLGASNTFSIAYSDVMNNLNNFTATGGSIDFDSNCIDSDPMFLDSDNGDYHLKSNSPTIDQGTSTDAPADDIEGDARPRQFGHDMGADEYVPDNNQPTLVWTGESNYESDGVNPDSDTGGSSFEFRVKYTDSDNEAPSVIQVWVDENDSSTYESGEKYVMTIDGGDSDYTNGEIYTKTLGIDLTGDGDINYRFYASDGTEAVVGTPVSDSTVTVTNNAPVLAWTGEADYVSDGVDPNSDTGGSSFEFRVSYTDADNTVPGIMQVWVDEDDDGAYQSDEKFDMTETDGVDTDYTDGKFYKKTLTLSYAGNGVITYLFYASDGIDDATGAPTSDSTVTVQ